MAIKRTDFRHLAHTGGRVKPHYYVTPAGKFDLADWVKDLKNYNKHDVIFSLDSDAAVHPNYIGERGNDGSYVGGYISGREFYIARDKETLIRMLKKYKTTFPKAKVGVVLLRRQRPQQ